LAKAMCRTANTHVTGESDDGIVPSKCPNKDRYETVGGGQGGKAIGQGEQSGGPPLPDAEPG